MTPSRQATHMKPIWIVDDDQSIRWVLEKALARESLLSRSFTNERDVLAALEEEEPQVLISDIRMSGGSALDLLQAIKARHPGLPVIVMTAYSDSGLNGISDAFHRWVRARATHPDTPRPVTLNTWEAVYFRHDLAELTDLATTAAERM